MTSVKDNLPSAEVLLQRVLSAKPMTAEEEFSLWTKFSQENDAEKKEEIRNEFMTRNLRFVLHISKLMAQKHDCKPSELIPSGYMGMCRAFDKFNPTRGAKFPTYAAKWIQQYIVRGLESKQQALA